MRETDSKKVGIIIGLIILVAVVVTATILLWVKPVFTELTIELGEEISEDIEDYLIAQDFLLEKATLDTSYVNLKYPGTYEVYSSVLFYDFTFRIIIVDTIAPVITPVTEEIYLEEGKTYPVTDFYQDVSDISGEAKTSIVYNGISRDSIYFDEMGEYMVRIYAQDPSGNYSDIYVNVLVDEAPVLIGVFDRYSAIGKDIDLSKYVIAIDNNEGNVSERIKIDSGTLDINKYGTYEVNYSVHDEYGLVRTKSSIITICDEKEAKRYSNGLALTKQERTLLCESDYFTYEPLEEENYDEAVALVIPSLINLYESSGWTGSGMVYKITPEYVYFISAAHVTEYMEDGAIITFHNGKSVSVMPQIANAPTGDDTSMFRVNARDIPMEVMLELKEIHIDYDIYDKLDKNEPLVSYATHWHAQENDKYKKVKLIEADSDDDFLEYTNYLSTTNTLVGGMSGTATIDYRGNLVGIVLGHNLLTKTSYHTRIDTIPSLEAELSSRN